MERRQFYLTTAIPYVNADPHIGFALEIVQTDTLARYHHDLLGEDVWFLTGSDENSLKNVQAAEKEGISVQALVDRNAAKFHQLKEAFNLSFNDFIRTTEERHKLGAIKLWQACDRAGKIYKKKYRGLYCVGCEAFVTEKELVDGKCPEHLKPPEVVEEENYFFRLADYQKELEELIASDQLKIVPETRKNEILSFIRSGLEDFSISRSVARAKGWGIPVPGDESQIMYVWFDALANYITALDYATEGEQYKKYWPADLHVIGKGILRFHAAYWPAMLLAAKLPLPKAIFVHGYLTIEGQKISKTLGNVIDPFELVNKYGADAVRYYLLRYLPPFEDGNVSIKNLEEIYNADLANSLGNTVSRVAKLCEKAGFGVETTKSTFKVEKSGAVWKIAGVKEALDKYNFPVALEAIWKRLADLENKISEEKPWARAELGEKELDKLLENYVREILLIAKYLSPFLPTTAAKIAQQFSEKPIKSGAPLFPRLQK